MIRIATRSSAQARTQAEVVGSAIRTATGEDFELVFVDTLGDKRYYGKIDMPGMP